MVSLYFPPDMKLAGAVKNTPLSTNAKAKFLPTAFQHICG